MLKGWNAFGYFLRAYPARGAAMVAALSVAGLLEGVGIAALLPLISILTEPSAAPDGTIAVLVSRTFGALGLAPTIETILLFFTGIMVLKAVVTMAAIAQVAHASAHVTADLRAALLRNLLNANWLHYVGLKSGASAAALGLEAQRAAVSFKQGCTALSLLIQVAVYAALAVFISWKLTLAALGAGLFMVLVLGFLTREARRAGNEQTKVFERVLNTLTESLLGAKPLKAMNKGEQVARMMESDIRALQSAQLRMDVTDQSVWVLGEPLMLVFIALGLYGALHYSVLPLPELLFLALLSLRLVMRVSSAQRAYQSMAANESALWSLKARIDTARAAREEHTGRRTPSLDTGIVLEDLRYTYGDRPVLNGISLSLPARKFHVVYGTSGAGKTTLADLLTGLLAPGGGNILIDGAPLSTLDMPQWRGMIGYVPQDVLLFHDTIFNNIALGDPAISQETVMEALKKAEAWEFVRDLPEQLNTLAGERGARLSGGQRQRLALARAIVNHPALLILDEATSALDSETEQAVLNTVKALSRDMTVLAISHNPALLEAADHVYYLRDGKVDHTAVIPAKAGIHGQHP